MESLEIDRRNRLAFRLSIRGNERVRSLTARFDPTKTSTIVRMFRADIRRRLTELEKAIRKGIDERDIFGLRRGVLILHQIEPPEGKAFALVPEAEKNSGFARWLADSVQRYVLEDFGGGITPAWIQKYIRAAYGKGAADALAKLQAEDPAAAAVSVQQILGTPFHLERLGGLFQRNFSELKGFTDSMENQIRRIIADGLLRGDSPKKIAREAARQIGIERRRAERIARTEIIRTNAEATLNTFERFGIEGVELEAEWITAGDDRVCPDCSARGGKIYKLEDARGMIPLHPNCRCTWIPVQKK